MHVLDRLRCKVLYGMPHDEALEMRRQGFYSWPVGSVSSSIRSVASRFLRRYGDRLKGDGVAKLRVTTPRQVSGGVEEAIRYLVARRYKDRGHYLHINTLYALGKYLDEGWKGTFCVAVDNCLFITSSREKFNSLCANSEVLISMHFDKLKEDSK